MTLLFNGSNQLYAIIALPHRKAHALSINRGLGGPKN
jgi:hypothetical protein